MVKMPKMPGLIVGFLGFFDVQGSTYISMLDITMEFGCFGATVGFTAVVRGSMLTLPSITARPIQANNSDTSAAWHHRDEVLHNFPPPQRPIEQYFQKEMLDRRAKPRELKHK
jgi:hypothetical protein